VLFPSRWLALGSCFLLFTSVRVTAQAPAQATEDSVPKRDLMDVLSRVLHGKPKLGDTIAIPPKLVISVLPAFGANPTVGFLLGVSGNAVTRFGPEETTNLSTLYASVSYTTKQQFNVISRSNLFTADNVWKLEGDWRYLDTNQPTYGLGPALPKALESPMDFKVLRFYETVYREITSGVLAGIGYHFNRYYDIVDKNAALGPTPFSEYNGGATITSSSTSGFSFNLLKDARDNPINTTRGFYVRGSTRFFPRALGSEQDWGSVEMEARAYPRLKKNVLALWGLAWITGGRPPYLELPAIGWDYNGRTGRAYAQGRIRATDLLYGEAEYRVTLTRNGLFGAVGFLNLTSAADATGAFQSPDPGYGLGLRIKLNKHSNTNITIDYGFGAEGSKGVFFGTGEVF
jgi:outer membrane protein assembly factor BamA